MKNIGGKIYHQPPIENNKKAIYRTNSTDHQIWDSIGERFVAISFGESDGGVSG